MGELLRRVSDRVLHRRQYAIWEAGPDGAASYMIAGGLTRDEAIEMAKWYAMDRLKLLVVDGAGATIAGDLLTSLDNLPSCTA